jgi:PST family polysaccharide transporter
MDDLSGAVRRGVAWVVVGRGVKFAVNAAGSVLLARLLEPRTFGLFAVAGLFLAFTKQLQTFGMAKAAVRLPELKPVHLATVFAVNAASSTALCAGMWLVAPLLETLFHEDEAVPVLRALALGFLVNPFSSVGSAVLDRRMDFRSKSRADVLFALTKVGVSVALALAGFGVWSLTAGMLVGQTVRAAALFLPARWWPSLRGSRAALGELAGFGAGMFVKNLTTYVQERVDYFVVGRWLGVEALGFYERAYRMPDAIVRELGKTTNSVLFSAFSKIQDDRERLRRAFVRVLLSLCLPSYPALAGMALVAPALVPIVFGQAWIPTVAPLQVLCVAGYFRLFSQLATTLMNAMGRIRAEAAWRTVSLGFLAAGCWIAATRWGIVEVALAILLIEALLAVALTALMLRTSGLSLGAVVLPQLPVVAATAVMTGSVLAFQRETASALGPRSVAMLASSIVVGGAVYTGSLLMFRNDPVREVMRELLAQARPLLRRFR